MCLTEPLGMQGSEIVNVKTECEFIKKICNIFKSNFDCFYVELLCIVFIYVQVLHLTAK